MQIGIAVLSGVGITMLFFTLMFFFINRTKSKTEKTGEQILEQWRIANDLVRQKIEVHERIADALEKKVTP